MGNKNNTEVKHLIKATAYAVMMRMYRDVEHELNSDTLLGMYCSLTHLDRSIPEECTNSNYHFRSYSRKDHVAISFLASEDIAGYVQDIATLISPVAVDIDAVHQYLLENFKHCADHYYRRPPVLLHNVSIESPIMTLNRLSCVLNNTHLPTMLCHMTGVDMSHPDVERWIACYEKLHRLVGEDVVVPRVDMSSCIISDDQDGLVCVPNNRLEEISVTEDGRAIYTDQQTFEQPVAHEAYYFKRGNHGRWWYRL